MTDDVIASHLAEAERTEGWDMQKLRMHLTILERCTLYMSPEDHRRYMMQVERMRAAIKLRFGSVMGS